MRIHLDTDFGGDPDDACALVMLLGCEDVEVAGVTTNLDSDGRRASCVDYYLGVAGHSDVSVAAGAGMTLTGQRYESTAGDSRYWPEPIESRLPVPGAALQLLETNIQTGATVLTAGPLTNLATLELQHPGVLRTVRLVVMGGWVKAPEPGLPPWGPEMDFNVQADTRAAEVVAEAADVTLVTLPVTLRAQIHRGELPRLRAAGRVGALLARQLEIYAEDKGMADLGRAYSAVAEGLVNFMYDPVAAAVAVGWDVARIERWKLRLDVDRAGALRWIRDEAGREVDVVVDIAAPAFMGRWLSAVECAALAH